jgi:hypothetical protein
VFKLGIYPSTILSDHRANVDLMFLFWIMCSSCNEL